MHDIEPYYGWRERYDPSEDEDSPFFGREHSEFMFTEKIYNYYIHPQWDYFGSDTLYMKLLFADYDDRYAIIELIGEWNDCLHNDVMFLKRNVIDPLMKKDINRFVIIMENVLNFHGDDDCYYEEWAEDVSDERGWVCCINMHEHVKVEMESTGIQYYVNLGGVYDHIAWRGKEAHLLIYQLENVMNAQVKQLRY
ncbi:MAG: hypothetical protein HKN68_22245 [Saprospiraceae bacterium]|nr:hypothetical protein [Saprospiraceae bacterium]